MLTAGVVVTLLGRRRGATHDRTSDLTLIGTLYVTLHWLSWPAEDRLVVAGYLVILAGVVTIVSASFPESRYRLRSPSA